MIVYVYDSKLYLSNSNEDLGTMDLVSSPKLATTGSAYIYPGLKCPMTRGTI